MEGSLAALQQSVNFVSPLTELNITDEKSQTDQGRVAPIRFFKNEPSKLGICPTNATGHRDT